MKNPNPNLWRVRFSSNLEPNPVGELWVCAGSAGIAEKKARRVLKKLGHKRVVVDRLKHEGTIDAF